MFGLVRVIGRINEQVPRLTLEILAEFLKRTRIYTAAQVAETYGCKYWLGDARNTSMLDIADQDFLVKDLVTIISKSGIRKIARLVDVLEAVVSDSFSMKFRIEAKHPEQIAFETAIFTSEDSALDWLFE